MEINMMKIVQNLDEIIILLLTIVVLLTIALFSHPISIFIMVMWALFMCPVIILFLLDCKRDEKEEDGE